MTPNDSWTFELQQFNDALFEEREPKHPNGYMTGELPATSLKGHLDNGGSGDLNQDNRTQYSDLNLVLKGSNAK